MRRHGPMVLAVCRRVTAHAHDAEDAFQAAFLVLARKADRLGPGDPVGGWLYGVAVRAARKAAARAWRRQGHETLVAAVPDVPDRSAEPFDPDAAGAVIEEVERLPEGFRAAVVLCELEGRSRADAARELGIAEGTLSSRLAAARKRLAERLAARGFAPAVLAPVFVPPGLASTATALGSGTAASPAVAALAHGLGRAMILHHFRAVALAAGLLTVAAFAAGPSDGRPDVPRPTPAPLRVAAQPPAPKAKAEPAGIVVGRWGDYHQRFDAEGKKLGEFPAPAGVRLMGQVAVSPDGARMALVAISLGQHDLAPGLPYRLVVRPVAGPGEPKMIDLPGYSPEARWTPDGKEIVVVRATTVNRSEVVNHLLDPATGQTRPLALPDGCQVLDVARDGKTFLVEHRVKGAEGAKLALAEADGMQVKPLTDLTPPDLKSPPLPPNTPPYFVSATARFSPDGKTVLFTDGDPARKDAHKWARSQRLYLLDVATGKRAPLADFPENGQATGLAWAPDGKRIAYTWAQLHADMLALDRSDQVTREETEGFLMVADPDGRNARTVASDKGRYFGTQVFAHIDWR